MTQGRVENTRVHFWTVSPVSVKIGAEENRARSGGPKAQPWFQPYLVQKFILSIITDFLEISTLAPD